MFYGTLELSKGTKINSVGKRIPTLKKLARIRNGFDAWRAWIYAYRQSI